VKSEMTFDDVVIGDKIGPKEYFVDKRAVRDFMEYGQWDSERFPVDGLFAPTGFSVVYHIHMLSEKMGGPGVRVWLKSEHEYFQPVKLGSKIIKEGKFIDKYTKRGRDYIVYEIETFDEEETLLFRSRETLLMSLRKREDT